MTAKFREPIACSYSYTRKISQLVNKMCSQRLVASLSTSCNNIVVLSSCYMKVVTHNLLTSCSIAVVGTTCNKSVELKNLVASCQHAVDNLSTSWEQAVPTHPVDKLLEQHCYKFVLASLLQLVRFYVCIIYGGRVHCTCYTIIALH